MWFNKAPQGARVSDAAPPFALQAHDGTTVRLVDFRGQRRVVLAFYPEDDTPG
jgi:peroxiredoxin